MKLLEFTNKHPHPNPPPSRGREYLYKSPPLAGGARGGGLKSLNLGMKKNYSNRENGIALVTAMIISLVVMFLIAGTLYFLVISTGIAGAGKRYSTAEEAADGAVQVMKDIITLMMLGEKTEDLPVNDSSSCLPDAVITGEKECSVSLMLPGTDIFKAYHANISVKRLYSIQSPGSDMDFTRSRGSSVFYRINTVVTGPAAVRAETTVLYRYVH